MEVNEQIPVLWQGGEDYFALIKKMIDQSVDEIHLQTYIFDFDETGKEIMDSLILAADRGVKVFLVLDAYGSGELINKTADNLKAAGIHFKSFSPSYFKNIAYTGRRLHHKILCCDKQIAMVGGINIANKYRGNSEELAWLDYGIYFTGNVCKQLAVICKTIFEKEFNIDYHIKLPVNSDQSIAILQNDWLRGKNQIFNFYLKSIKNANKNIVIVGAYFLPGFRIKRALKKASQRGVKITLLLTGISDVPLVRDATRFFYAFLFRYNIKIYEWKKSVLHGKLMIVDDNILTVGSFNVNHLSQYGSLELNMACNNPQTLIKAGKMVNQNIADSELIKPENVSSVLLRFKLFLSFYVIRMMMIFATLKPYLKYKTKVKKG